MPKVKRLLRPGDLVQVESNNNAFTYLALSIDGFSYALQFERRGIEPGMRLFCVVGVYSDERMAD